MKYPQYLQIIAPLLSILARMHKETIVHRCTYIPICHAMSCHVMMICGRHMA